jgi:hypothetical protein
MTRTEGEGRAKPSRRKFLINAGRIALLSATIGSDTAFLTESIRSGPPERLGQLDPEAITTAVRTLGLQAVNLFLINGVIKDTSITKDSVGPQDGMHYFTSDKSITISGQGIHLIGGFNRQIDYGLSFALPEDDYKSILAAGGNNRNAAISNNLTILSMSVIGQHGNALDNEMALVGMEWTDISTRNKLYPTTDKNKVLQNPHRYRLITLGDVLQFGSDMEKMLAVFSKG